MKTQLSRAWKFLLPALTTIWNAVELRDLLIFGGLFLLSHGVAMVYAPAAWMVFGAGVFAVGYFGLPRVWSGRAE